jgi:ferric iron reductase protein FhuF
MMIDRIREELGEHFNLVQELNIVPVASLWGESIVDPETMSSFLSAYQRLIEGQDQTVAAAYFTSWFGDVAAALQYTVSVHHAAPNFSLANLRIHLMKETGYTRIAFQLEKMNVILAPKDSEERTVWLEAELRRFYSQTVRPLMECLAKASGLHVSMLWGQLPTALQNYRENIHNTYQNDEALLRQFAADEKVVQNGLQADVFGLAKNPLRVRVRLIDHPLEPSKRLAINNVCCLQYLRQGRSYCYTCPRLGKKNGPIGSPRPEKIK